jgi:hypothetical protein
MKPMHFKIEIIHIEVGNKSFKCILPVKIIVYIYIYIDSNMFVRSKVGEESKQRRRGVPQSTLQVHTEAAAGAHLCLVMIWGCIACSTAPRKKKLVFSFLFIYLFVGTKKLVFIYFIFIFW